MLLLLCEQEKEPDIVLFADTGGEQKGTYDHVANMRLWCEARGIPFVIVSNGSEEKGWTLEENCLKRRELPSLAYGFKGCSVKWKRQPMDRYLRDHVPQVRNAWLRGEKVIRYIGIDAGETRRKKLEPDEKFIYRYPLVEAGIDRDGCIAIIQRHAIEVPPKSSCFFCPAMKKAEIQSLPQNLKDRALAMEENAKTHTVLGLGRSWSWTEFLTGKKSKSQLEAETATAKRLEEAARAANLPDFADPPPCDCTDEDVEWLL